MKSCTNLKFILVFFLTLSISAYAADVVISTNTNVEQDFTSGTNTITVNTGIVLSNGSGGSAINQSYTSGPLTITNNGTITSDATNQAAIFMSNTGGLLNNGAITFSGSNGFGLFINFGSTGTTITNLGAITGAGAAPDVMGGYCMMNCANIGTLNNLQGGNSLSAATTGLTFQSNLPNNYNIVIQSSTHYGQLAVSYGSGTTTFGISNLSTAGNSIIGIPLVNVLTGISPSSLTNTGAAALTTAGQYITVISSNGYSGELIYEGSNNWDLTLLTVGFNGPSAEDTQASLAQSAQALRGVYDLQNVSINNNLNNDCTLFDVHGICSSVTGAQNYLSGGVNNDTTSGTLNVAYRINDNVRIGAYLDQNLNTTNVTGVHLNNGSPAFGAFAVWNTNSNGLGTQLRVSAGYADKDMTVTRHVIGTSEAGSGTTSLKSYGASIVGSYAMAMPGNFIFSPYAGLRYTKVAANGYKEASSDNVTAPLTYSALTQNATTAIVGARWTKPILEHAVAYASLGLEQDINNNGGTYTATGVDGLTPIAFNANINRTRPTASIGSYYKLGDRQRIAANLVWSEETFTTNNATSLMVTYTAVF